MRFSDLRDNRALARARLIRLNLIAQQTHQDLGAFMQSDVWRTALAGATGPRVVIATNTGGHFGIAAIDRMLAAALTLRGARVLNVLCDAALSACQMCEFSLTPSIERFVRSGPDPMLCNYCHAPAQRRLAEMGLPVQGISAFLGAEARAQIDTIVARTSVADIVTFTWNGIAIGDHALAGALRFFARSDLDGEQAGHAVLRQYFRAALQTAMAYAELITRERPDVIVAHHGIYVPQGLVAGVARAHGVRVVTWNPAYRRHCFIFSHDDTYHHTLMDEPVETWATTPLDATRRARTIDYLQSRWRGEGDWISFNRAPSLGGDFAALDLDPDKPLLLALTNVFWDAQLHYPANAFPNQMAWLTATIEHVVKRDDVQLAIRIHPAERTGAPRSRQRAVEEIRQRFPTLPPHIVVVPPESHVSSYALAARADTALIYGTKMGVELSAVGLPVIVAGEAWVRGKGFSEDIASAAAYEAALARLPRRARLSAEQQERAQAYAHHFFFRRMIELPFVSEAKGARRFTLDGGVAALAPGASAGLDVICAGILESTPFLA